MIKKTAEKRDFFKSFFKYYGILRAKGRLCSKKYLNPFPNRDVIISFLHLICGTVKICEHFLH